MIHPYNNDIYGFFKQTICDMISAMKRKVERIANDLAGRLKEWDSVDTITIAEWADMDIYDPYFFLSLDVYYQGKIPSAEKRRKLFSDAGAFETSSVTKEGQIPARRPAGKSGVQGYLTDRQHTLEHQRTPLGFQANRYLHVLPDREG